MNVDDLCFKVISIYQLLTKNTDNSGPIDFEMIEIIIYGKLIPNESEKDLIKCVSDYKKGSEMMNCPDVANMVKFRLYELMSSA